MRPLLHVADLTVDLMVGGQAKTAIHNVTFELAPGSTIGLVGESGSGKSITARAIGRLLPRGGTIGGAIEFDGQDISKLSGDALRQYRSGGVGMIFQDPRSAINPVRRIGDFLTETLTINLGMNKADASARAVELLAQVGIEDGERRLRQYPHELSGGLLQRVMIASVVGARPRLILADEPTTALDVTTQAGVISVLSTLRAEYGMAMVFITHDLELAAAVCDHIAVMYAGSIVEMQSSADLLAHPKHPYTSALLQARPDIDRRSRRLLAVPGQPTTAFDAPTGCAFAPRCGYAEPECEQPLKLIPFAGGLVRCRRSAELSGTLLGEAKR